jgi:acyl transferase domain-containing protein
MAHLSLRAGGCAAAVVAGVKLILTPSLSAMFTKAGMLSPDGRCKTLDAAADGYVRGEAVAAMMLQAVAAGSSSSSDGSSFAAVLLASAVNQDGRSSGLTAPNGPAQQAVIRAALADGGLTPDDVTALSMHGTGTPLGELLQALEAPCRLLLHPCLLVWRAATSS